VNTEHIATELLHLRTRSTMFTTKPPHILDVYSARRRGGNVQNRLHTACHPAVNYIHIHVRFRPHAATAPAGAPHRGFDDVIKFNTWLGDVTAVCVHTHTRRPHVMYNVYVNERRWQQCVARMPHTLWSPSTIIKARSTTTIYYHIPTTPHYALVI